MEIETRALLDDRPFQILEGPIIYLPFTDAEIIARESAAFLSFVEGTLYLDQVNVRIRSEQAVSDAAVGFGPKLWGTTPAVPQEPTRSLCYHPSTVLRYTGSMTLARRWQEPLMDFKHYMYMVLEDGVVHDCVEIGE